MDHNFSDKKGEINFPELLMMEKSMNFLSLGEKFVGLLNLFKNALKLRALLPNGNKNRFVESINKISCKHNEKLMKS